MVLQSKESNRNLKVAFLIIIYVIIIASLYPIISYYLVNFFNTTHLPQYPFQTYVQVYLSGPVLLTTGCILFFCSKSFNKLFGVAVGLVGLIWLILIIIEVITKN